MKALLVLSAVVAVALSATISGDRRYNRPGQYVPWQQQSRYYNSYSQGRNVYQAPRWYQSTAAPVKIEASSSSPWLSQGKSRFSFGSAIASTPKVAVQAEAEKAEKVESIVAAAPAAPKVPAGFGAFHFGKKLTPTVVAKEEVKPIESVVPEIIVTKTVVESSGSAEASLKPVAQEEIKQVIVESIAEVAPVNVSPVIEVKSEESVKKSDIEESHVELNKTSLALEKTNVESVEKIVVEAKPEITEIKSEVVAPQVIKKKHGFSFSFSPSWNNRGASLSPQAQPSAASLPQIKPQLIVSEATEPAIETKPTLKPATFEYVVPTLDTSKPIIQYSLPVVAKTPEPLKDGPSTVEYVVPTADISKPIIQYSLPVVAKTPEPLKDVPSTFEYVVPTADISKPIIQYSLPVVDKTPKPLEDVPSTVDYVVPTADISKPIIQYALPSVENVPAAIEPAQTTTETSDYTSEYSPINSESFDALLSTTLEPELSTSDYSTTEFEASTTENTPVTTESVSSEYLQNDIEPAQTTAQPQIANIESLSPIVQYGASLLSKPAVAHGFSFSSLSSAYKAPAVTTQAPVSIQYLQPVVSTVIPVSNVWSNSYNARQNYFYTPSFSYFNKQPSYQPQAVVPASPAAAILSIPSDAPSASRESAPIAPELESTTLAESSTLSSNYVASTAPALSIETVKPVAPQVFPAFNSWSNSYNANKNGFAFSYNPSFSSFNKPLYYQPQVVVPASSAAPAISSPAPVTSSSSPIEITSLPSEPTTYYAPEYASTTALFEESSESTEFTTTESALPESTTLYSKYETPAAPALSVEPVKPVAPQVFPAFNSWSNSYNANKNGFSFSYNPSFSYFNKQPYYQPQVVVPASSAAPAISSPAPVASSSSPIEITSLPSEPTSYSPEYASTTALFENSSEGQAGSFTTEASKYEASVAPVVVVEPVKPVAPQVFPAYNSWSNSYNKNKNGFSFSYDPGFSYFNKPLYQPQIVVPSSSAAPSAVESTPAVPEKAETTTILNELTTEDAEFISSTTESYSDETTTLAIESEVSTTQESIITSSLPPVTKPQISAYESWKNAFNTKKSGFSFSFPSFNYNRYSNQPASSSSAPVTVEVASSYAPAVIQPYVLPSSNSYLSKAEVELTPVAFETAPAKVEPAAAGIESSIKEAINGQLSIASISKPVAIESAVIKSENITQSSSASASIVSSPVFAISKPAVIVSAPQPLPAFPAFQQSYVPKKHGFSFSYKPSGNYYKKPEVIVAAPIVESSSVIASAAPAIIESSSELSSVAPTLAEPQEPVTRPSLLLSLFNTVKSALGEKTAEAAVPLKINSEGDVSSQYDIAVKSSPVSAEKEVEPIHDLRLGN